MALVDAINSLFPWRPKGDNQSNIHGLNQNGFSRRSNSLFTSQAADAQDEDARMSTTAMNKLKQSCRPTV